jgi:hypothetical protein
MVRPQPRRPHHHSSRPGGGPPQRRPHPPRHHPELPPEFEQLFGVLDEVYGDIRTVAHPLDAELWVSAFLGGLWKAALQEDDDPEETELGLVEVMELVATPRTQAVLCALALVGSPDVGVQAAQASERLARKGVRRPAWQGSAEQPVEFVEGWSVSDVFADGELLIASFRRGPEKYAFTVTVANNAQGSVVEVLLVDPADLPEILREIRAEFAEAEGVFSLDRLDAAELRRRLEPAVRETVVDDENEEFDGLDELDEFDEADEADGFDGADEADDAEEEDASGEFSPEVGGRARHGGADGAAGSGFDGDADRAGLAGGALEAGFDGAAGGDGDADAEFDADEFEEDDDEGDDFAALRALILSRLAALPEPSAIPGGAEFGYDLADLPALLDEFAGSDEASDLPHRGIVREWAEIFARLGIADFAGDPPLYGPEKFDTLINVLIPSRVTAAQQHLEMLEPTALAWARWSTRRVGLTEAVTDYLVESVEDSLLDFEDAYSDPEFVMDRHMFGFTMRSGL